MINKVIIQSLEQDDDVSIMLNTRLEHDIDAGIEIAYNDAKSYKNILDEPITTLVIFVIQTLTNDEVSEKAGGAYRFLKRTSHPSDLVKFSYGVLGLGDSNLLLDRQTTTAKDCNKCGYTLDKKLSRLGAVKFIDIGVSDERTGNTEIEVWLEVLLKALNDQNQQTITTALSEADYTIRYANESDVYRIHNLIVELAEYEKAADQVVATVDDIKELLFGGKDTGTGTPHAFCHVVEVGNQVVGMAFWHLNVSTWRGKYGIYLEDLYVTPDYRQKGLGKALLQNLQKECDKKGYPRLTWQCLNWNTPSLDFYKSMGANVMEEWLTLRIEK